MKISRLITILGCLGLAAAIQQTSAQSPTESHGRFSATPLTMRLKEAKWSPMMAELGEKSPQITILRVDPVTQATHLMIRVPKNFHVPMNWHTGNEMLMVLRGKFIININGKREELERGDFNYVPAKMPHEGWTKRGVALLYITTDHPWDLNWTGGTPVPADMIDGGRGKTSEAEAKIKEKEREARPVSPR